MLRIRTLLTGSYNKTQCKDSARAFDRGSHFSSRLYPETYFAKTSIYGCMVQNAAITSPSSALHCIPQDANSRACQHPVIGSGVDIWIDSTDRAKFWMVLCNEVRRPRRGRRDLRVLRWPACDAIEACGPDVLVQPASCTWCDRRSRFVSYADRKAVARRG